MTIKTVKWGVVTAGRITHTFARDIAFCRNTHIHGIAARKQQDADAFAEKYGIENAYEGYDALYNDPQIDAIYIASPHTFHAEQAAAAIRAGKHVLCEKPITTSVADLEYLIGLAQEHKVFLMEAMWTYFLPAIVQAKQWVESGEIGELVNLRCDFGYPIEYDPNCREYNADWAGGCVFDMGIYPIAFNWLFHKEQPSSFSRKIHRVPNGVEDDVVWQWQYADSTASLHTSFRSKLPNIAYLIGTKGTIEIPDFWRTTEAKLYELEQPKLHFVDHRLGSGFEFQIDHACECIRNGQLESDIVTFADSLAFQRAIDEVRN